MTSRGCTEVNGWLVVLVDEHCSHPESFESFDVSSCSDPRSTSSSLHYHSAQVFVLQSPPIFSPLCLPIPQSDGLRLTLWAHGLSLPLSFDGTALYIASAILIGFVGIFEPSSRAHSNERELAVVDPHPGTKDLGGE